MDIANPSTSDASNGNDDEIFPDGSIEQIYFLDFLTYNKVKVISGKNLNLIIGPNGSGKSSIICGICLAVGGSPKILGRSESIGDFVKHGKETGSVEVFIADSIKGTQRVKVVITRSTNKAEYYINEVKALLKEVKQLALSYNIQIDNPCTFLAQDKVKGFSEQNPIELLKNTEKAGNPKLLAMHEELIKKRDENKHITKEKEETEQYVANMKAEIEGMKVRVSNYNQQQLQDSKIRTIASKLAVRQFEEVVTSYKEKLNATKKLEKKLISKEKLVKTLDQELTRIDETVRLYTIEERQLKKNMFDTKAKLSARVNENSYQRALQYARNEYETLVKIFNNYESEINDLQFQLEGLEKDRAARINEMNEKRGESTSYENLLNTLNGECEQIDNNIYDKQRTAQDILRKIDNLMFEEKRNSPYDERIQALHSTKRNECSNAASAFRYLTRQGINVHVPYFELVVKRGYSLLIDNLIPVRDLLMFIFENREDETRAASIPDFKINTTVVRPEDINNLNINARLPSKYAELGFVGYAIELLQGPDVVLNYLCNVSNVHKVPVTMSDKLKVENTRVANALLSDGLNRYVVGKQINMCFISNYSKQMVTQCRPITRAKILFAVHEKPIDMKNDPRYQKRLLEEQQEAINHEIQDLKRLFDNKNQELRETKEKQKAFKELEFRAKAYEGRIERATEKLNQIKLGRPDLTKAQRDYDKKKKAAAMQSLDEASKFIQGLEELIALKIDKTIYETARIPIDEERSKVVKREDKAKQELNEYSNDKLKLEYEVQRSLEQVDDVRDKLFSICKIRTIDETKLNQKEKELWHKLKERFVTHDIETKTTDELEKMLADEKAVKKMRVVDGSAADVEKFKELKKELIDLENSLAKQNEKYTNNLDELQKKIAEWRDPINKLIDSINVNYQKFFSEINCIGEVHLEPPSNELDIADYGIMIMVSFRASEKVRRLDHQVQSGGERSVSTMLYLLALQELCPVPFRCVDEINQGMDPTNERKVFEIMVNKLTGSGNLAKTQYFLLTPKLLHNLSYNEKISVQIVHNGGGYQLEDSDQFDARFALRRMLEEKKLQRT